jgi:polyisoprenoid-binding protein YceI
VSKTFKILLGAFVVVVVLAGALVASEVLHNSADDQASLGAIATGQSPTGTASGAARTSPDGSWKVQPGDGVFVGYRIHEKLRGLDKEVTGRTPGVTGTLTVAGTSIPAAAFSADLTGLKTDEPLRDNTIKRSGPETAKFPTATFKLTAPVTLPSAPKKGEKLSATAKGDLTVHGVTKPVEVPLDAQWDGDTIKVATSGQGVRLQFEDYGFAALEVPVATTDDFGFLEVQLLFVPA